LVGSDRVGQSGQSIALALSGDGNSLIVGGQSDYSYFGACWIFTRSAGVWTQQGKKIIQAELTLDPLHFGTAVSMSGDGNTAVVGGFGSPPQGAIWVFTRTSGIWKQQGARFIGSGATNTSRQCCALALSADGDTLIDGSPTDYAEGQFAGVGAAWVFGRTILQITPLASVRAGLPASFQVQAVGPNHTVSTNVNGNVTLTSTDSQAVLPRDVALSQGTGTFVASFKSLGPQNIIATYDSSPLITGTSSSFSVMPPIVLSGVANAASFIAGPSAPNTLVAAFGEFPNCASGAQVSIDSAPVTVFGSASTQINFLIPPIVAGRQTVDVQAACGGYTSQPVPMQIATASPGVFTISQNGTGQAAVVNQDGSSTPPSPPGSVVTLYGTGFGSLLTGSDGLAHTVLPVTATIGDSAATVLYAGEAPGYTSGLQQINILIPPDTPPGSSVPLRLAIGGYTTQAGVTLAIR
jgi:uncharacterized protein (TIGR03437 family)